MNRADDLDDPFINQYADKVTNPEEVLMRADFARAQEIRDNMPHAETEQELDQLIEQADAITVGWSSRHDDLGAAWRYLRDAHDDWTRSPETMRRFHEQVAIDEAAGAHVLSGIQWRSQQQAREMTGHGFWYPAAESAPRSALADYQPGQALADAVARNGSQRDGAER
ncbi:hypothetical protein ACQP2U_10375 [Nocardia sp. CA-084685]|uniref:hypothetical protein n=1 Tax=Nocardia sp. CA-084685 TaxID=3239970 RepID=UPI003D966696